MSDSIFKKQVTNHTNKLRPLFLTTIFLVGLIFLFPLKSFSYYSTLDTGTIVPENQYRFIASPQLVTTGQNDGTNISGIFDMGMGNSSNIRALAGFGATNFYSGLFYKWVPYPDFEDQPAVGIMGGAIFSREDYNKKIKDVLSLRIHPLVSKLFETEIGLVTPYASLPIGVTFVDGKTVYPIQFVAGSEFKPYNFERVSFMGELGLKVDHSFSYIALAIVFVFDNEE